MKSSGYTMRLNILKGALLGLLLGALGLVAYGFMHYGDPTAEQHQSKVHQGFDVGYLVDNSQGQKDHILVACDGELDGENARATSGNKRLGYVFVTDGNGAKPGCGEKGWGENLGGHNICDRQLGRCSEWSNHGLNAFLQ